MGHREDLLAGAKSCLYEKGYARTTARDIVEASGANLASIGYHYGTKEALLNAAIMEALEEWVQELKRALADVDGLPDDPITRFEVVWTRVIELFERHRPVWGAQFDAVSQRDHVPEVRSFFVEAQQQAQKGLVGLLWGGRELPERTEAAVGQFYHALLSGVMMQWVVDPEHASTGESLAEALRTVAEDARHFGSGAAV
ncbi:MULTISPECIES: TetR/AcrR family transcriptional regulator [unclassified Streptomyces]|jgi:AcrR family transcriptional regulator|uniref:TetR/AcrR family transcriptional regulator n=1 Tax=unclassified Streptomyces TaxID=2593676 RepID=UPI000A1DFC3E|nr:TetR/AcrR family transcriptional regulator [Streptomyces sp. 13-12-16]OSP43218.1 TetR family transcriptional regulator [Streptomyces sp. 13-12-16]WCL22574.1 TetR/AcrR family transcriptional regulator [Streptomyces sp.]